MPKKKDPYVEVLDEIRVQIRKQNSLGFTFVQGMTRGLGTALGATVLVAVLTSIALHFTGSSEAAAFVKSLLGTFVE